MIRKGILNPALLNLLARVRHTNTLVISDRGFPSWPQIETVDISLVDDVPTVPQVVSAIQVNFKIGRVFLADEFRENNSKGKVDALTKLLSPAPLVFEKHGDLKKRVPFAIGLIRTADTTSYSNLIIESA